MGAIKKQIVLLLSFVLVTGLNSLVQTDKLKVIENFEPSGANQTGKEFPQVNSERCVLVSILDPEVDRGQLDIGSVKYDLIKEGNVTWTGESALQDAGFHYCQLIIDGVSVPGTGTKYFYRARRWGCEPAPFLSSVGAFCNKLDENRT